ncbi:hypothetical protein EDB80DRAFT_658962 [Ilyonectria destructans]|nr:hypothetical protein EDB80DRAFT_658962 [Ilyonectria destructans]
MSDGLGASPKQCSVRKSHGKSRNGCLDCRRRRVKCGEERPSCRVCVRRDVRCQYPAKAQSPSSPSASVSALSDSRVPLSHRSYSSTSEPTPATTPLFSLADDTAETFGLTDLCLLHHWTVSTSLDLCRCPGVHHIWQIILPEIGFKHTFVLHALLSFAALHIAHQDPSERKVRLVEAVYHHNKALDGFQSAIRCITEENSEALFTWSICNVLYVFAMSNPRQDTPGSVPHSTASSRNDNILGAEWIPMIRGMDAVLQPTHNYLRFGRMMSTIMSLGNWDELDPDQNSSGLEDSYFCGSRETWKGSNGHDIYEQVLQTLRKCRLYSQQFLSMDPQVIDGWGYNRAWSGPITFIHFAPESYFPLLQQRQPPALVLFAFFGALLHELNDYWFLEGWGKAIVEVVADILGSYWRPWISWPLQVVQRRERHSLCS